MHLIKRTYSLPSKTLESFESQVPPKKRSSLVATLLGNWLASQRRQYLRKDIAEGCREMADLYLRIEEEYHPLEEEVQRALDVQPKTRGRAVNIEVMDYH